MKNLSVRNKPSFLANYIKKVRSRMLGVAEHADVGNAARIVETGIL